MRREECYRAAAHGICIDCRSRVRAFGVEHDKLCVIAHHIVFGADVLVHSGVPIEMVGGDVGYRRAARHAAHGHELKAGKLKHGIVAGLHFVHAVEQWSSDVSADVNVSSVALCRRGEQEICQRGRSRR